MLKQLNYRDLPLEKILEYCGLEYIKTIHSGSGWCGTRYLVKVSGHFEAECRSMDDVRTWLLDKQGAWIEHIFRCKTDPEYAERQRRYD